MLRKHIERSAMLIVCAAVISSQVWGDALNWSNPAGGAWSTPGNWSPAGGPPTAGDTATFNLNNTYSVQTGTLTPSSADAMTVTDGRVTLESSSNVLLGRLNLTTGAADLTVEDFADLLIGSPSRALQVNVGDRLDIAGFVEVRSNADLNASVMRVGGAPGFSASLTVNGSGSTLMTTSPTLFSRIGGEGGTGALILESNSSATLTATQIIQGTISVESGSTLTVSRLFIGLLAGGAPGNTELSVTGTGSVATQSSGITDVGISGHLEVQDFGTFNADSLWIRGGTSDVAADGTLNANSLTVFNDGELDHVDGAINVAMTASVSHGGIISIRGGVFNANTLNATSGGGLADIDGGTVNVDLASSLDGGKTLVRSGKLDAARLFIDSPASRLTLDGGEVETGQITRTNGGQFDWKSGVLTLTAGTFSLPSAVPSGGTLNTARDGAVTINGPFFQSPNSTINAQGNTTLGSTTAVNGFASQGTLAVNNRTVTLRDANDAVFDSAALVTLGTGSNPGTLVAANGVTVDFGANITGFGTVNTPDNATQPLINNGHIAGNSAAQRITLAGYVKGVGTLNNVLITGTDAPGFSPATVYRGSVVYNGTLEIEVGGTTPGSFDRIIHSGVATLGGTLDVSLLGGFTPTAGDVFQIITAGGGVSGTFANEMLPTLGGGLFLDLLYDTNAVTLSVVGVPGDYNLNGVVDAADYIVWRKTVGQTGAGHSADGNGNGQIDPGDYTVWRANFGRAALSSTAGLPISAAAPEPAGIILLVFGLAVLTSVRKSLA